ncbi:hypothetical protein [Azospirillum rugosum]|uniref:Uncharacterized protein n=1 Tax=Azospirillum rugosum TaxID=416170 RepID=A0ABS4SJ16_9PROT|nr:hypothetical protein [Azospirillum rugosum]MBP2292558.1 hypothetical protein [Azospirillum rugosum]MDQ0526418.1 hypothetical protein [Azospirillum rugosum]
MRILDARSVTTVQRARAITADELDRCRTVAYWKFVTGALFFSACSLLPSLLPW